MDNTKSAAEAGPFRMCSAASLRGERVMQHQITSAGQIIADLQTTSASSPVRSSTAQPFGRLGSQAGSDEWAEDRAVAPRGTVLSWYRQS